jgi:hypothetical protein
MIGRQFPREHLAAAFAGQASGSFDDLDDQGNQFERQPEIPLIEIYAPFYRTGTQDIIAVGEVYNSGERLASEVRTIRFATAGIVAAVTAPMMFVLFLMVWRANSIVARQRASLSTRVMEARALAAQNDQLRREADDARLETIESNERLLGQIGQDLHDGPIQLLSILTLKLTEVAEVFGRRKARNIAAPFSGVNDLTLAILTDLRNTSMGLVLPQLEGLTADETLRLAISLHESMTGTTVTCDISGLSFHPEASLRICLFRIVQEGLNNAYHHANGRGQHVTASENWEQITIVVSDRGADPTAAEPTAQRKAGLGLLGLRRRVSAFRGSVSVTSSANGTRLVATTPIILADHSN